MNYLIKTDELTFKNAWFETIEIAERYNLSLYDACYLELSLRCNSPLATFDNNLKQAAKLAGVDFIVKGQGINLRLQAELSLANKLV